MTLSPVFRILVLPAALCLALLLGSCGKGDEKVAPKADMASPPVAVAASKAEAPSAPVAASKPEVKAPPVVVAAPKPPPPATPVPPAKPVAAQTKPWKLLGQKTAEFKRDYDRLAVGKAKGMFQEIRVTVQGAPLAMESITVTFGNDEQYKPQVRHQFNENSGTRVIDLPGEKRAIRHVDFVYRSTNINQGRATVQLHGR